MIDDVTRTDIYAEIVRNREMIETLYWIGWTAITMLVAMFLMLLYKLNLHRRAFDLLALQDKMVRENLGIQNNINASIVEIAKGYSHVLKGQTEDVKKIVEAGVTASAEVAARLAATDSQVMKTIPPPD